MAHRGEIRVALVPAFEQLAPCGWRDVVPMVPGMTLDSPGDVARVRKTVENMVLAGELVPAGKAKEAGSRVWHSLYEPASWYAEEAAQAEPSAEQMREDSLRAIGAITGAWGQA